MDETAVGVAIPACALNEKIIRMYLSDAIPDITQIIKDCSLMLTKIQQEHYTTQEVTKRRLEQDQLALQEPQG